MVLTLPRLTALMSRILKIQIASFIALAFVLRIVSVNVLLYASLDKSKSSRVTTAALSSVLKKRRNLDDAGLRIDKFSNVEVCEETNDNEEETGSVHFPVLFSLFAAFLIGDHAGQDVTQYADQAPPSIQAKRYLALSILRI